MTNLSDHTALDAAPLEETLARLKEHHYLGYWTPHHCLHLSREGALQLQSEITTKPNN